MNNRIWALLFLLVPVAGVAVMVVGPFYDIWLPVDVSQNGHAIDHLYYFILWLTGSVFVGTELALFYFIWRYDARTHTEPAKFVHGSHKLEVVWTILPAATLVFLAIYQMNVWAADKMRRPPGLPLAEITGRQFEWRIRYPGRDGRLHTPDDIFEVNDLHVPVGEEVLLALKSEDVLHSFFLPNFRLKQDAVPGMRQMVWFQPTKAGQYDIVCAELCGWGHYKMKGRLTVETRADFEAWLEQKRLEQWAHQDPEMDEE